MRDIAEARDFYGRILGCPEGRSAADWVDFDFHGHQIVAHLAPAEGPVAANLVDGHPSPVRHFGLILERGDWNALMARLREAGVAFPSQPQVRFEGQAGEQATAFLADPSGNALEFKAFAQEDQIFAK